VVHDACRKALRWVRGLTWPWWITWPWETAARLTRRAVNTRIYAAMAEKGERFLRLVRRTGVARDRVIRPEPKPPSPDEILTRELGGWAGTRECREVFLPLLDEKIQRLDNDAQIATDRGETYRAAKLLGQRWGLMAVRSDLMRWAGEAPKGPR
jgi:hypothetical protein